MLLILGSNILRVSLGEIGDLSLQNPEVRQGGTPCTPCRASWMRESVIMQAQSAAVTELKHIHCHANNVSRGNGHSAVAAAAYATRSDLTDIRTGRRQRYTRKESDLVVSGIVAPVGAPSWVKRRGEFWNRVEAAEKRKDARVAKTIRIAIPREIPRKRWKTLVEGYATAFAEMGVVVDYGIHYEAESDNPHAHLVICTRPLEGEGFSSKKLEMLNRKKFIYDVRQKYATCCNIVAKMCGSDVRYTADSYAKLGIARKPTRHRGKGGERPELEQERAPLEIKREIVSPVKPRERLPVREPEAQRVAPRPPERPRVVLPERAPQKPVEVYHPPREIRIQPPRPVQQEVVRAKEPVRVERQKERKEMAKPIIKKGPDITDKVLFPHLTARADWPPTSREPAPDMNDLERSELRRYMDLQERGQKREVARQVKREERRLEREAPGWFEIQPAPEPVKQRSPEPFEREREEMGREYQLRQDQEAERLGRNPVHRWLEQERDPMLRAYEVERARQVPETMEERRALREARRSGDQQAIDRAEIERDHARIIKLREEDARRLQDDGVREEVRHTMTEMMVQTPEEQKRLQQARGVSSDEAKRVLADQFQSRMEAYEQFKQDRHDRHEQNPREREEFERLNTKARKMLPSCRDMQRLKDAWDVTLYTFDRRPMEMTYQQVLEERMNLLRAREQDHAREQDRKEREREDRDRIRGR